MLGFPSHSRKYLASSLPPPTSSSSNTSFSYLGFEIGVHFNFVHLCLISSCFLPLFLISLSPSAFSFLQICHLHHHYHHHHSFNIHQQSTSPPPLRNHLPQRRCQGQPKGIIFLEFPYYSYYQRVETKKGEIRNNVVPSQILID